MKMPIAVGALAALIVLVSLLLGPATLSLGDVAAGLIGRGDPRVVLIVRDIRLPRIIAALFAGAALGGAGAALQGLLRNPLADPGVLGVSSAASLAAVLAVYFGLSATAPVATPIAAMAGALGATALLYALGGGAVSTERLILVGVGISSACGALTALAMNLAPNPFVLSDLVNWLFGTVANRALIDDVRAAPFLAAGFALLVFAGPGLSALALGEETAASLGADLSRLRLAIVVGAALLVGASVALAGAIGFVGVVAPHLARPLVRHDPGRLIAPAAAIGAVMVAAADLLVRVLPFSQELKLGVAAALFGAPAFVVITARTRRIAA